MWFVGAALLIGGCSRYSEEIHTPIAAPSTSLAASPTTETNTSPGPELMPSDGTHKMGGIDGKHWGTWESDGPSGDKICDWSVRRVNPDAGTDILDSGQAEQGENARTEVQPDGDVDVWTGEIDGHVIVFMTDGCQPWRWVP
ncbi:hypothetical protein A5651_03600 [Mycobacterium sp. 1274761.0]|nr:hypothetical protein A5651_03600 [Mycobacterium sp. 1274761.0]